MAVSPADPARQRSRPRRSSRSAIDATISESVTVLGVAPTIDASPAASTTLLTSRDLELRHPQTLSQALDVVPGVSTISEGQAAVPAIRGLARGRTLILVDGSRASTERRAGANASFLDPGIARTIEVARGPGSVAYGSDAFGGVIAARTRGPDYGTPVRVRFAGTVGVGRARTARRSGDLEGLRIGRRPRRRARARRSTTTTLRLASSRTRRGGISGVRVRWEHATGDGLWSIGWQSDFGRALGRPRSDSDVILATQPVRGLASADGVVRARSLGGFRNLRFDALVGAARQRNEQDRLPTPTRPRSVERADLSSRELQVRLTGERVVGRARLHVGADVQGRYGLEALDTTLGVQPGRRS